jgi:hypothetical protein
MTDTAETIDTIAANEATLCRILAEVLNVELVRPEDGFFEVGGDSVLAVAVVARAREAGLVLTVRDLFDHQTAETLAAVIGEIRATSNVVAAKAPLMTFADDEFGEFEDVDDVQAGRVEAEWETIT